MAKSKDDQAAADLRDRKGGTYDVDPGGSRAKAATQNPGDPTPLSEDMPEGMQRKPKDPLNKNTGRR